MLQKQTMNINFAQGLDTKSDPKQIPIGKFSSLVNSIFTKGGLLQKRNGFGSLPSLPDTSALYCTTFNGDLTAIGTSIEAYSTSSKSWYQRGSIQPLLFGTPVPLIRNNLNQIQSDSVTAPNGFVCTVYTELQSDGLTKIYRYVVADSVTGQNIVAPTTISTADATFGTPRVFLSDSYFIVVYTRKVTTVYHLEFFAISTTNPSNVTSPADISTSYTPASTVAFDGYVLNGVLYLAWNGASTSGIKMAYVASNLSVSASVTRDGSHTGTMVSVCADVQAGIVYAAYWDSGTENGYVLAVDGQLNSVLAATLIIPGVTVNNIVTAAQNGFVSTTYEAPASYGYNATPTHRLINISCSQSGTPSSAATFLRSVGVASKMFIVNGVIYLIAAYQDIYQNTYFLTDLFGHVIARWAYGNGGGYQVTGNPSVTVYGSEFQVSYLFADQIQAVNKGTAVPSGDPVSGVFTQTGINLATLTIGTSNISTAEIGTNLNITGGFLWAYDGYLPVEQNFFLYPYPVGATTDASAVTPTGTVTSGSNVVTAVSDMTGVGLGALITGTAIPANQTVTSFSVDNSTITFGPLTATGTHAAETITVTGNISTAQDYYYVAIYSWTDNQGNRFQSATSIPIKQTTTGTTSTNIVYVPTLRLTYKTANPVKIELYRWSTAQQVYYQVTSINQPTLNSVLVDSVTIVDALSDASILGNSILYTTGGVVEDTAGPASSAVTLFDDRLWMIDAEDPNLLWFSKQVIEATPVEMSQLLTLYVAPTLSAQGSTGAMKCLAAMDDKLIIFKKDAIYYINGSGPDNTGANSQYSQPIFITSSVGCSNPQSIVLMPQGLMFQSDKGIWLLGRDLQTQYIGAPVEEFNDTIIQGAVGVPATNQDRFTSQGGTAQMYDYYYGQWGTFTNVPASSSTLFEGLHTYISPLGQVFQETPNTYLDGTNPVLLSIETGWINLAGLQGYQRAYAFYLLGQYFTPFTLICSVAYDYNESPIQFTTINPTNFAPNYGSPESNGQNTVYGSDTPMGGAGNVLNWRVFLKKERCTAIKIALQEIYDPSFGVPAGQGFSLSGLQVICGIKSPFRPISSAHSVGTK